LLGCGFFSLVVATSAAAQESHQEELQELRQLVSTLVGAEPVDPGSGERIAVVLWSLTDLHTPYVTMHADSLPGKHQAEAT
jgi:hypothetical protein